MRVHFSYLAQIMAMAINETMHTPPTKEPAIRESCWPSSDLYSSAVTTDTESFCLFYIFEAYINPAEHF